jgi:hypothetical protein
VSAAELLHVLMLPDFERADRIGEFWSYPENRAFPLRAREESPGVKTSSSSLPAP